MTSPINMNQELVSNISRYRLSLDNQLGVNEIFLSSVYNNIVMKQILENFPGVNIKYGKVVKSGEFNFFLKNLKTFLYGHFKILNNYNKEIKSFQSAVDNELEKIEYFYLNSLNNYDSVRKTLGTEGSSFKVVRDFKQRNVSENYDLKDFKNKDYFQLNELTENSLGNITSKIKFKNSIVPVKANIEGSSEEGEIVEKSEETSFLWRKGKRFKYIVYKEEKIEVINKTEKASLSIIFDFGFIEKINNINIDEGSYLPATIQEEELEFLDGETWKKINIIKKNKKLRKTEYFISPVYTQKIKMKIDHFKSLNKVPVNTLNSEEKFILEAVSPNNNITSEIKNYNIYDMSLDEVSFNYYKFSNRSIYRESIQHEIEKLKYVNLEINKINSDLCFVESELEIQYFLNNKNWNSKIIPVPTSYKVEEVLIKKENNFLITFPVKENTFVLKAEDGTIISRDKYEIKIINDKKPNLYRNYYIETNSSIQQKRFFCEYIHSEKIEYENCFYENGKIKFEKLLLNKKAIVRPRFIFRNYGKSENSCYIENYILETNENSKKENVSTRYKILKGQ